MRWSGADLRARIDDALEVYCAAMHYPLETGQARKGYVILHTRRPGFRAVAALGDAGAADLHGAGDSRAAGDAPRGGPLIGFGYGYEGQPGQWWHDEVRAAVSQEDANRWLGNSFELCELHVHPDHQARGTGRLLLQTLLENCPYSTVVLSTPEGESLAWHLYRRIGFVDIARHHRFPGDDRPFGILGLRLRSPAITAN